MSISIYHAAGVFYGLEALQILVQENKFFNGYKHSHVRLLRDITNLKTELNTKLALALKDYIVLTCFGEALYCEGSCEYKYFEKRVYRTKEQCNVKGMQAKYHEALSYDPENILKACVKIFSNSWDHDFGGEKWRIIAKHGLRYGVVDDASFIDNALSLSHNNSPFIDKTGTNILRLEGHLCEYVRLLDNKFTNTPFGVVECLYDEQIVPFEIASLMWRVDELGFLNSFKFSSLPTNMKHNLYLSKIDIVSEIRNYKPLEFKHEPLKLNKEPFFAQTKAESKKFNQIHIGDRCIHIGSLKLLEDNENSFANLKIVSKNAFSGLVEIESVKTGDCVEVPYDQIILMNSYNKKIVFNKDLYYNYKLDIFKKKGVSAC